MTRLPTMLAAIALVSAPTLAAAQVTSQFKGINGSVTAVPAPKGVLLKLDVSGLTPGWHGIHFHEKADCSDAAFKASGGHVHDSKPLVHGLLNPQANDQGDLTNIHAGADGTAKAEIFSGLVTMAQLQDADGSAVVIHAKPDDYTTQPIGGAGDRVGCAVVK